MLNARTIPLNATALVHEAYHQAGGLPQSGRGMIVPISLLLPPKPCAASLSNYARDRKAQKRERWRSGQGGTLSEAAG